MNFRNFDFNLLVIFDAVYSLRNGTAAAKQLKIAQPNLARAIQNLRDQFGDQLFVRTTRGYTPTERANALAPLVRELLSKAETIYTKEDFDLKQSTARVSIATTDYMEVMLADCLIQCAAEEAPKLTLNFRPLAGALPKDDMERGDIDIAMAGFFGHLPGGFFRQKLFDDPFVLVMRKGHPLTKSRSSPKIDDVLQHSFVLISTRGDLIANFDRQLAAKGKKRHLALAVPNSLSAVWAVVNSDLLLVASQRFIGRVQTGLPIVTQPIPTPMRLDPINLIQAWHQRTHEDPVRQWVRSKIFEVAQRTY